MQFPLLGFARDFHPLDNAHAERTEKRQSGRNRLVCRSEKRLFLLCFSGRLLSTFSTRFLFFQSWIELVGDEDDAIVLGALLINPFIWLEVTLNSQECSLCQLVKRLGVLVLAPCLHADESRYTVGLNEVGIRWKDNALIRGGLTDAW